MERPHLISPWLIWFSSRSKSKYLKPFVKNHFKHSLQITLKSFEDSWNYFYLVSLALFLNMLYKAYTTGDLTRFLLVS